MIIHMSLMVGQLQLVPKIDVTDAWGEQLSGSCARSTNGGHTAANHFQLQIMHTTSLYALRNEAAGMAETFDIAQLQRLADKAQAREGRIPMDQQAHDAGAVRISSPHLLGAHHAQHHWADSLQMAGVGRNAHSDCLLCRLWGFTGHLLAVFPFHFCL